MNFFDREIKKMNLVLTLRCNMNCSYCYVKKRNQEINLKTAKKAVGLFLKTKGKNKSLVFFGGEPLIKADLLKLVSGYALKKAKKSKKNLNIGIETNGTLLTDDLLKFIEDKRINLSVSFDGKTQDKNRRLINNRPSSKIVENNIKKIEKYHNTWKNLTIMTTTKGEGLMNSIKSLHNKGINRIKINILTQLLKKKDLKSLKNELKKIDAYKKKNKDLSITQSQLIDKKKLSFKKNIDCGIRKQILVKPDGTIISCEAFINSNNRLHILGNVNDKKIQDAFFYDNKIENLPFCAYFNSKNGKALNSKELNSYIKKEINVSSYLKIC